MIACLALIFLWGCRPAAPKPEGPLFRPVTADSSGFTFQNILHETEEFNLLNYTYMYSGGGVGIGDFDQDGLPDILMGSNQEVSRIFRNLGGMHFEDKTLGSGLADTTGWTTGTVIADVNGDGLPDIYLCRAGLGDENERSNLLYLNQGNFVFREAAKEWGIADHGLSVQAAFFDKDHDGDLDLFVVNHPREFHVVNSLLYQKGLEGRTYGEDKLYENQGDHFTDVSAQSGILPDKAFGLSLAMGDFNGDGLTDIHVSNDFWQPDYFYLNQGDGTFKESLDSFFRHVSLFSMGSDLADLNNDGLPDLVAVDMLPEDNFRQKCKNVPFPVFLYEALDRFGYKQQVGRNVLQLQNEDGSFSEIGQMAGISNTDWAWTPLLADFDGDGNRDLFVATGMKRDMNDLDYMRLKFDSDVNKVSYTLPNKLELLDSMPRSRLPNYAYRNRGDLTFEDVSLTWGLGQALTSNGAAYADLDRDGDLDLVVNNLDTLAFLFENQSNPQNFLELSAKGKAKNPFGIGLKAWLFQGEKAQYAEVGNARGFQSCTSPELVFGLKEAKIDSLAVEWPGGARQVLIQPKPGSLVVSEDEATVSPGRKKSFQPIFKLAENTPDFLHQENDFNDFLGGRILPWMLSREGPGLAVGDLNGDQREDILIGGAAGQKAGIYFQEEGGEFLQKEIPGYSDPLFEEQGILIFDADNDGDQDVFVASGSNEFEKNSPFSEDRLLLNDGQGNLSWSEEGFPLLRMATSSVTAEDFDQDGDLDLFVCGRMKNKAYAVPVQSMLFQNNRGKFSNVTREVFGDSLVGNVRASLWLDYDQDGWKDLLLAGEFMPLRLFRNEKGKFREVTREAGLSAVTGLWRSLQAGDFDNDGDIDFVAGNLGLNSTYKATPANPMVMYVSDFNRDGLVDPILTYSIKGVQAPFVTRDVFCTQLPEFNNKFLTYESFARASLEETFGREALEKALKLEANSLVSTFFLNENGKFRGIPLPNEAQIAPVFGMLALDVNEDSFLDLVLCGNSNSHYYEQGSLDASLGLILLGQGNGTFKPLGYSQSGFRVDGDAKAMALLYNAGLRKFQIIITQNNGPLKSFLLETNAQPFHWETGDAWAELIFSNGKKRRLECRRGEGYLSQSGTVVPLPAGLKAIKVHSIGGKVREINF
ncbi:MAG: VCBS repeat-containing protein [Bacteroidia bacterium]|nr:VCBS repeat-containing protein [Bacteroidia bacterium]